MKVGVAGLGAMGANVAARLMEVGHQVTVWNRSADKAKPLANAGAKVAGSPADAAAASEAVITMLTDGAAIDAVYNGPNGLLSGDVKGKMFIEMSTVAPRSNRAGAQGARQGRDHGRMPGRRLDRAGAQGPTARPMGAEPADAARACPMLEQLCRKVEHCGPVGAGAAMKLAINLPLMVAWQAYGEAFAIARSVGWEPQRLLDLFVESNGANNALKMRAEMIVKMFEGKDPGTTTFSIANGVKDLRTMVATGEALGADMPATKATLAGIRGRDQERHRRRRRRADDRVLVGTEKITGGGDEAFFLLALARDLPRAHRTQSQGHHARRGDRRQSAARQTARGIASARSIR